MAIGEDKTRTNITFPKELKAFFYLENRGYPTYEHPLHNQTIF